MGRDIVKCILSLDPGETTGFVIVEKRPLNDPEDMPKVIMSGILSRWRGVRNLIKETEPEELIVEQFRLYPNKAREQSYSIMIAARVIGAIECIAEDYGLSMIEQAALVGRRVELTQAVRDQIRNRHALDAMAHAVAFLRSHYGHGL